MRRKKKVKTKRDVMRDSNTIARSFLIDKKFDNIWLKPHYRYLDTVWTQDGTYQAQDLWNLFDGIAFDKNGNPIFLQIKTDNWPNEKQIKHFIKRFKVKAMAINVKTKLVAGTKVEFREWS